MRSEHLIWKNYKNIKDKGGEISPLFSSNNAILM